MVRTGDKQTVLSVAGWDGLPSTGCRKLVHFKESCPVRPPVPFLVEGVCWVLSYQDHKEALCFWDP